MSDRGESLDAAAAIARLERWETHGGAWQVLDDGARDGTVSIALLRCDGGEEVDRLDSADTAFREWLAARRD